MRGKWEKSLGCWLGKPALPVGSHEGQAYSPPPAPTPPEGSGEVD